MDITLTSLQVSVLQVALCRLKIAKDALDDDAMAAVQLEIAIVELQTQLPEVFQGA